MGTLRDDLYKLGDTDYKVADVLRRLEIRGRMGDPDNCPVAKYLRQCGHKDPRVVNGGEVEYGNGCVALVPAAVYDFVVSFDSGSHSDLQEEACLPERPRQ